MLNLLNRKHPFLPILLSAKFRYWILRKGSPIFLVLDMLSLAILLESTYDII